jgi:hypothetical protein
VGERTTNQCTVGGLAAALVADGPITTAPQVSAGCKNPLWASHPFAQLCDGPIQGDGTWQRCMTYGDGFTPHNSCAQMSAGQPPGIPILSSAPTHIDDDLSN